MKYIILTALAVACLSGCCRTRETATETRSVAQYVPPPPVYAPAPTLEK